MEFRNFGDLLNYIRRFVIEQPKEDGGEGDDLKLEIYDDEISITVNDLYDGPMVTYNSREDKFYAEFRNPNGSYYGCDEVNIEPDDVILAAHILNILKYNKELVKTFLNREEM